MNSRSVAGAAAIKYESVIFLEVTKPNLIEAIDIITTHVVVAVVLLIKQILILGSIYVKTHMDGSAQGWRCLTELAANASSVRLATASLAAEEWIPLAFPVSSQPRLSYDSLPNLR
nr:CDKN2A-interacting protein [Ipomoea batatas]